MPPNLVFSDYDIETAEQDQKESEASGAQFMKLKVGKNVIRILPMKQGQKKLYRVIYQHWVEFVQKSVTCARLEARKPCKVCEKIEELKKSPLKLEQDTASDMWARRQVFVNVIDRKAPEKGPQVLRIGKSVHEQLLALRTDDTGGANYSHPIEGVDVVIDRTGTTKNDTKYKVILARKASPLGSSEEVMQKWIDEQKDLDTIAALPSIEDVTRLLSGSVEGDEDDEDEDVTPKRRPRTAVDDAIDVDGEEVDA